jgi:hypothetical protein
MENSASGLFEAGEIRIEGGVQGASTKIFINGQQIVCATKVTFEAVAGGLNKLTLELVTPKISITGFAHVVGKFNQVAVSDDMKCLCGECTYHNG